MSEIVSENPVNEATGKELRTRSSFDLNYVFFNTMRFGEYSPHFWMEGVNNDRLPLQSSHTIRSYTLGAPLMSDIKINKDYFFVPMQAILPLNWNKFIENPVIGQDVPVDCGTSVVDFWTKMKTLAYNSFNYFTSTAFQNLTIEGQLDAILKGFVFFERIYSDGSLMANLGIHGNKYFKMYRSLTASTRQDLSYDQWFDEWLAYLMDTVHGIKYISIRYGTDANTDRFVEFVPNSVQNPAADRFISLRDYLELLRDDFTWTVAFCSPVDSSKTVYDLWTDFMTGFWSLAGVFYGNDSQSLDDDKVYLDLRRLWAYQLICAHYYTNDKVDYIYSAELFRQYIGELCTRFIAGNVISVVPSFTVNGLEYHYDALSAHMFDAVVSGFANNIFSYKTTAIGLDAQRSDDLDEAYAYFRALFGFNRSLRYKDYFTASNTRPLAVGDVNVSVNSNLVNIVDVTRNIQRQRFFNAVNRLPHQIEDYLAGIFGKRPAPDYHNPFFLARTTDDVFGQESEYTGNVSQAEMNNITSVLRSNASRFAFEFEPDRDCVVLGITSFDLPRVYSQTIERQCFHANRFDAFNPYMQFIGDQTVYKGELGVGNLVTKDPFGYQLRHMEYKQRYNQCAGGFRKYLPGWCFIADNRFRDFNLTQNPDFIRSHNTELDQFYKSLTGYALGSYFHFIVKNANTMKASRPMAYAPSIL